MKFLRPIAIAAAAMLTLSATAQQPWQKLQMPTASHVERTWKTPPSEYGPEPYYGLNGAVDTAVITRDLDTMRRLGFRAVTVQAGYGMPFAYLSPEYFKFFRTFLEEAKKRDMRVWIVDDAGYPSGFAGGKFTSEKPNLRMQALEVAQTIPVAAGETIDKPVDPAAVAVTAVNLDNNTTASIPVTNNAIAWTAPQGHWQIMVIEHQFRTSPTRSDTNPRRVKDAEQSLEDYLDPAATMQFLAFTHEQYKKYVGDEFGKTIMGFRGDEPDYSIRGLPWTPKFFSTFEQIKGYDIRPYLASFFLPKLTARQQRAKADYYDVFSQMFRDGFFKVQGDWCAANHLEYQVHLNHEEMEMALTRSEGDFFRDMRYVQVPGIDAIWHQIDPDTISDYPRLASSVSHVYGKPRAFTESFAAYRPTPTLDQARYILNEQFVRGINLVEAMYFPATSRGVRPPPAFMADPGFPALMQYTQRISYLMSMGRPAASVALYLPSSSMWMGDKDSDEAFVSTERMLSERQIDFDIVSEDALASGLIASHGIFTTLSGNSYRTVILPNTSLLSEAALDRLHTFVKGGGRVLFLGHPPALIAGRTILDARTATPADFSWATVVPGELSPTPTPPAQPPTTPPTPQIVPEAFKQAIDAVVPAPDITLDQPSTALRSMRRHLKDADVYLLFNESPDTFSRTILFRTTGKQAELWDPQTGAVTALNSTKAQDARRLTLSLKSYETCVIVFR
ncbi:glycosyl hydrolase [Edaphobacter sp.]|uniref:glycosyl hydrolase n=1 Tax=Edaphobacter sp. TaxID=1934404 RepID=UPI002DBE4F0E|nr:glycosyl hydrolase [Edaphobacter sp.]HEU5339893.1 glycosyl hydrolase [Edaphobacter sp.]